MLCAAKNKFCSFGFSEAESENQTVLSEVLGSRCQRAKLCVSCLEGGDLKFERSSLPLLSTQHFDFDLFVKSFERKRSRSKSFKHLKEHRKEAPSSPNLEAKRAENTSGADGLLKRASCISGPVVIFNPWTLAVMCQSASMLLQKLKIDDPVDASPVHGTLA